jgi:tRNA pseudouridine38-40 synthase
MRRMAMLLRLAYDGTDFHGFARQAPFGSPRPQPGSPGSARVRTVQSELEAALARLYKQPILTRGASRTDAGVHAHGQIVAFDPPLAIPPRGLLLGLAAALPEDLIANAAWPVDGESLNPRFHNLGKHYSYRIRTTQLREPISARFEWHIPRPLDVERMREAAPALIGAHDFAGFRAADCQAQRTVRRIQSIDLQVRTLAELDPMAADTGRLDEPHAPAVIEIDVRGDAFLKNMVRIMVGTLVAIGHGRFGVERIDELLREGDRARAGQTAPAHGLTLVEVLWPAALGGRHF